VDESPNFDHSNHLNENYEQQFPVIMFIMLKVFFFQSVDEICKHDH